MRSVFLSACAKKRMFFRLPLEAQRSMCVNMTKAGALSIYSSNGTLVKQVQLNAGINTVNISNFAKGVYLLKAGDETTNLIVR